MTMRTAKDNYILDLAQNRRGYALNRMCGSLKQAPNRARFTAGEAEYCNEYGLSPEQKTAVLERDWIRMADLGGSVFFFLALAMLDHKSMQHLGAVFTGMTAEEFTAKLRAGGRNRG